MKYLLYDCFAGISGDMNLGAMLDLGVPQEHLVRELEKLPVSGYRIEVKPDSRRGVTGTKVDVILEEHEHHDHEHSHGHGHDHHDHEHDHPHDHDGDHTHEHHDQQHAHDHDHAHHHHESGSYGAIREAIENSALSQRVKEVSLKAFRAIAEAEAKIHGHDIESVHFHEVGSVDAIVDIVGAAVCYDYLNVDGVISFPVELGGGKVRCAHGIFPVPAPAVAEILKGVPVKTGGMPFEATTPTGAAILTTLADRFVTKTDFTIEKIGYGLGTRDSETPNALRLCIVQTQASAETNANDVETAPAVLVEANIDDMNPEQYEYVMDLMFEAGARDVFLTPIIMKKSRPAVTLSALCTRKDLQAVRKVFFLHTSTLGIRERDVNKCFLRREESVVDTRFGEVRVKQAFYDGRLVKAKPEYEDCRRLAARAGVSYETVSREALGEMEGSAG